MLPFRSLILRKSRRLFTSGNAVTSPRSILGTKAFNELDIIRYNGYRVANLDPLGLTPKCEIGVLHQVKEKLGRSHEVGLLENIYERTIGYEFGHLSCEQERSWLIEKIENEAQEEVLSIEEKRRIGKILIESEVWDGFMSKRFGQVKRYGLEGCEAMLVSIDAMMRWAGEELNHVVIGMPHRGRLNLMVGLLGYPAAGILRKLKMGSSELTSDGTADVLSHLSCQKTIQVGGSGRLVQATLLPNSSHLESVNPIVQGFTYGLMMGEGQVVLPLQIHGDAAFNGQGVVMESLQMAKLAGFNVSGTVHLIVNNQLGFTTGSMAGRSCHFSTDLAKLIDAPVFHVNADDPEAVVKASRLAVSFRNRFGKDVFIDLIGYRRNGHNELDEPSFTQPIMYKAIRSRPSIANIYAPNAFEKEQIESIKNEAFKKLDKELNLASTYKPESSGIQGGRIKSVISDPSADELIQMARVSVELPGDFKIHQRLAKFHVEARKSLTESSLIDWATAEAMAVGSLLKDGISVRLCGQDVGRGTFSHRHWQFTDQQTGEVMTPLSSMAKAGARLEVVNSFLSEFAVSGFELGLSWQSYDRRLLPIWEAQFGDFFNGAQIIWDAYLSGCEQKWGLRTGMVVLLPHGYDGAGPEHSSARLERWLQMCDEPIIQGGSRRVNMTVVNPTTPSNYYHLLRRQCIEAENGPLIVASPKTLLRLPAAQSSLKDLINGQFEPVIGDGVYEAETVVLCSGKFYYDLVKEMESCRNVKYSFIRIEELCPWPRDLITTQLKRYKNMKRLVWCQEEPENMGAYSWAAARLTGHAVEYVGREAAAAPAAGYSQLHKAQLATIYDRLYRS